jgi:hypothetical protein
MKGIAGGGLLSGFLPSTPSPPSSDVAFATSDFYFLKKKCCKNCFRLKKTLFLPNFVAASPFISFFSLLPFYSQKSPPPTSSQNRRRRSVRPTPSPHRRPATGFHEGRAPRTASHPHLPLARFLPAQKPSSLNAGDLTPAPSFSTEPAVRLRQRRFFSGQVRLNLKKKIIVQFALIYWVKNLKRGDNFGCCLD